MKHKNCGTNDCLNYEFIDLGMRASVLRGVELLWNAGNSRERSAHQFSVRFWLDFRRLLEHSSTQDMVRVLNVAEKNDAAKNIASILSRGASTRVCLDVSLCL